MTEPEKSVTSRLNKLRAGVLGANDGIVSVAALIIGIAATTTSRTAILTAGLAGLIAGATSMALGEYVSVSTQRDAECQLIATGELLSTELVNPWQAAASSAASFILGALLPLLAMLLAPASARLIVTFAAVLVALGVTGCGSAYLGGIDPLKPTARVIVGGALAMTITYLVGRFAI